MAERTDIESGVTRVDASGRRQYSVEFKRRLARMALEPGASVAGIALAHRINANQMFKWRHDYLRQSARTADVKASEVKPPTPPEPAATLLPVVVAPAGRPSIEPAAALEVAVGREVEPPLPEPGQIEIVLGRTRVRVTGVVDPTLVAMVLNHLHRR